MFKLHFNPFKSLTMIFSALGVAGALYAKATSGGITPPDLLQAIGAIGMIFGARNAVAANGPGATPQEARDFNKP